jgi:hypothetical protein
MPIVDHVPIERWNDMIRYGRRANLLSAVLALSAVACLGPGGVLGSGDDEDVILVGSITVATTTTGPASDPNGYLVQLNEALVQPIGNSGSVTFSAIPPGQYGVQLTGVDGTCVVTSPNPVSVLVLPDSSATANFDIDCP